MWNNLAPEAGTIAKHEEIITTLGYVWYGKLGAAVSNTVISQILNNKEPKILLIHSGAIGRYWAYIDAVQKETPEASAIPAYYLNVVGGNIMTEKHLKTLCKTKSVTFICSRREPVSI